MQIRIEIVLFAVLAAFVFVAWRFWAADRCSRIAEGLVDALIVGLSLVCGFAVLFVGTTLRWQDSRSVMGIYLIGIFVAAICSAFLVLYVLANAAYFNGISVSNLPRTAEVSLYYLTLMLCLVAFEYVARTCWPGGMRRRHLSKSRFQFSLRSFFVTTAGVALTASFVTHAFLSDRRFDAARWRLDPLSRNDMLDDLIYRYSLAGMRRTEIQTLLGGSGDGADVDSNYISYWVPEGKTLFLQFPHHYEPPYCYPSEEVIEVYLGNYIPIDETYFELFPPMSVKAASHTDLHLGHGALRLTGLGVAETPIVAGECLSLRYSVTNASTTELNPRGVVVRHQHWLVRPDGRRTNAGIWLWRPHSLLPGGSYAPIERTFSTLGYSEGSYEFLVELQTVDGTVLHAAKTPFSIKSSTYRITNLGRSALEKYLDAMQQVIDAIELPKYCRYPRSKTMVLVWVTLGVVGLVCGISVVKRLDTLLLKKANQNQ
jgi:hypothetical protein